MADRNFYRAFSADNDLKMIVTSFLTNGASNPTVFDTKNITSVTRNGTGDWTVTLRDTYRSVEAWLAFPTNNTSVDLTCSGHSATVSSARVTLRASDVLAEPDGTKIHLWLFMKNSGA